ncbi:MAG: putative DNA binding domain-containing protein [Thermoflexales bacterium]|nr:putative DNA binding domain-containing protein [Thermoflexales bacterium]
MRASSQLIALMPEPDPTALAETLVAFANSDGGTVVLGFDEAGRSIGQIMPEDIESALRAAASRTAPAVRAMIESADAGGTQPALVIRVPRSAEMHSLLDGRVLIRVGAQNRALAGEEIRHLASSKSVGDFEMEAVAGATVDDLDPAVIDEYIDKREARTRRKVVSTREALLREIGALDGRNRPTVTGVLLFGRNPQAFLPHSGVVFVKFPGVEARSDEGKVGYGRREEIGGPLARIVENAWRVTYEEMRVGAVVKGLERQDVLEYPETAVREALVNAVAHRDYRLKGRRIEIRKFADRMEITSPGGLAGYMTLDNIIEEHFSRNPRLVQGLLQWGYIEELGFGIDRMIEDLTGVGHPPPRFSAQPHAFTVTMSNHRDRRPAATFHPAPVAGAGGSVKGVAGQSTVNERQARALTYMREHGRITNRDYQALCPDVTPETLRSDLSDLVDKGVAMRVGEKKGTYYILK